MSKNIRVVCRLRPVNKKEESMGGEICVKYTEKNIKVHSENQNYDFQFDRIFGPETNQKDVFENVAIPIIEGYLLQYRQFIFGQGVMQGYNGTIFAFGQTGSGKTFTMDGPAIDDEKSKGIIPRMMDCLFEQIVNANEDMEFTVKCSMLEIYNEKLHDLIERFLFSCSTLLKKLLKAQKGNLQIKEDKHKGIFIQDCSEIYVNSPKEMLRIMKTGTSNRAKAYTEMNERSSRSHSIFILTVHQHNIKTDTKKQGKIYFVDLAGSEKVSKTDVQGQQLEEAKNINKSLSELGNVINALTSAKKEFVNYRNSKLTRILQESLGGNSQTVLIIACSMCSWNDKETLSTLRFGNRAKTIKNQPIKNEEKSTKELMMLLDKAEQKIKQQEEFITTLELQLQGKLEINSETFKHLALREGDDFAKDEQKKQPEKKTEEEIKQQNLQSLTIFKQHIELQSIKEQVEDLQKSIQDQEIELQNKVLEIEEVVYFLNKTLDLQFQSKEMINEREEIIRILNQKFITYIKALQMKFEKLYYEHQEQSFNFGKFKTLIARLKQDLHFLLVGQGIKSSLSATRTPIKQNSSSQRDLNQQFDWTQAIESGESIDIEVMNKDKIIASISGIIEQIEVIEKSFQQMEKNYLNYSNSVNEIDNFLLKSPEYTQQIEGIFNSISSRTKKSDDNAQEETKNVSHNHEIFINDIRQMGKKGTKIQEEGQVAQAENLSTAMGDDGDDNFKKEFKKIDKQFLAQLSQELDKHDNLFSRLNLEDDEKSTQIQELVIAQRKTIDNLTKVNQEITSNFDVQKQKNDQKQKQSASQIQSITKLNQELNAKKNEVEHQLKHLQSLLAENQTAAKLQEQAYNDGYQQLKDKIELLEMENSQIHQYISKTPDIKHIYEVEKKLTQLSQERTKLFNEMYQQRTQIDEKDELLKDKQELIHHLQSNLSTLALQLEALKYLKGNDIFQNQQFDIPQDSARWFQQNETQAKSVQQDSNTKVKQQQQQKQLQQQQSQQKQSYEKHIAKPIRGGIHNNNNNNCQIGGGNLDNFQKINFLDLDKFNNSGTTTQNIVLKSTKNFGRIVQKNHFHVGGQRSIDLQDMIQKPEQETMLNSTFANEEYMLGHDSLGIENIKFKQVQKKFQNLKNSQTQEIKDITKIKPAYKF